MTLGNRDATAGKRAIVLPSTDTPEELTDLVARLSFYLAPMDDWTIAVPTSVADAQRLITPVPEGGSFHVPEGMDPRIETLHRAIAGRIVLVDAQDEDAVLAHHRTSDLVFVRDSAAVQREPWASLHTASTGKRVYPVDRHRYRMEGSQYIQAVFANSDATDVLVHDSRAKFEHLAQDLGQHPVAYLLATGPSIDRFQEFDFSDGLVIACNTTVLDEDLLEHARPRLLTFADPIFHFGCSLYAAEFRQAVRRAASAYDFYIVIPIKYYELYTSLEPTLASRVIGLPFAQREVNLDLFGDFETSVTDNVATFTMLPLATTFATHVAFLGFDGRKPEETYFWRHNPRTQLNHLMDNIRAIHPGFFNLEYQDYYERHCETLEQYMQRGEANGSTFYSLHPSAIPALSSRQRTHAVSFDDLAELLHGPAPSFRVITLNPDWLDDFGHYGPYDLRLSEAVEQLGGKLISVTNAELEAGPFGPNTLRCFSEHSWAPTRESSLGDVHTFERELETLLESYAELDSNTPTAFAMYVASVWHLPTFARLRMKFADLPWAFLPNLFLSHEALLKADLSPTSAPPLDAAVVRTTNEVRAKLRIGLYADSERLQRSIHRHTGERPGLWPMFSTTFIPQEALAGAKLGEEPGRIKVYCPANAQLAKGYDLLLGLAEATTDADRRTWELVTRSIVRANTPARLRRTAEQLERHTIALTGVLTDEEYLEAFATADVILIPYRFVPFASRTSAVLSDAVLLGKPVVATRGTWAGDWVDELGIGATFQDGDVDDMLQAVRLVCRHIDHYRLYAEAVRGSWAEQNSPMRLADVFRSAALSATPVDVDENLRVAVRGMTRQVAALAQEGRRSRPAQPSVRGQRRRTKGRRNPSLHALQLARRSDRSRDTARRLYRLTPAPLRKRIDDLVRSNPG